MRNDGQLEVRVERDRVWILKGVQSFMLDYEGETPTDLEWYANQLRGVLGLPQNDKKDA